MLIIAQICSLIIYAIILALYISNKHLPTYSQKLFKLYLVFGFFDIGISTIEIVLTQLGIYKTIQSIFEKMLLISFLTTIFLFVLYVLYETNGKAGYKRTINIWICIYVIGILLSIILPVLKDNNENAIFGYNCHIIYSICVLLLGMIFVIINHREKPITQKKFNIINMTVIAYLIILFIEIVTFKFSIAGIANTAIILILFFEFENPLQFIDRETGLYNTLGFKEYIDDCRVNDIGYDILLIDTNFHNIKHTRQLRNIINRYLLSYKEGIAFKHLGNTYMIIYKKMNDCLESEYENISRAFKNQIDSIGLGKEYYPSYTLIEDTYFPDIDMLMKFIEKFREENNSFNKSGTVLRTKQGDFNKLRQSEEMKSVIRKAIETDNILVFLQPIYSIKEQRIVSAEVLMRLRDIEGNILYPGAFMNIAENSGLIVEIESIILTKVCKFIRNNPLESLGLKYLEINLSVRKGESETLVEEYKKVLRKYNINPSQINLEITESTVMQKRDCLLQNINDLTEYGISFSLDDFGSGESNLNYIIDMPVSIVKFDKDMTQNYFINPKTKTIIEYTIQMIHKLGLKIVAEGVETKEQLNKMQDLGIDYIQGYYFSKPVSINNFIDYIHSYEIDRNISENM